MNGTSETNEKNDKKIDVKNFLNQSFNIQTVLNDIKDPFIIEYLLPEHRMKQIKHEFEKLLINILNAEDIKNINEFNIPTPDDLDKHDKDSLEVIGSLLLLNKKFPKNKKILTNLGMCYHKMDGQCINDDSEKYLKEAYKLGCPIAAYELCNNLYKQGDYYYYEEERKSEILEMSKFAAEKLNSSDSIYLLGCVYADVCDEQDKSFETFKNNYEKNKCLKSLDRLIRFYEIGYGTDKNFQKAKELSQIKIEEMKKKLSLNKK